MKIIGIIPSRYASNRFPGKALVEIAGKSMIQRVYEQASSATTLSLLVVATDDKRILDHVKGFGGNAILTSSLHNSGTERCNEAIKLLEQDDHNDKFDVAINIQGDEPFINPHQIDQLSKLFNNEEIQIATLIKLINSQEELFNPNIVKVITNQSKKAIYFSRYPLPFVRGEVKDKWLDAFRFCKHIGIYGYRTGTLNKITKLEPSALEKAEMLEQLRWLSNGFDIYTDITTFERFAIDTPEDLLKIKF